MSHGVTQCNIVVLFNVTLCYCVTWCYIVLGLGWQRNMDQQLLKKAKLIHWSGKGMESVNTNTLTGT